MRFRQEASGAYIAPTRPPDAVSQTVTCIRRQLFINPYSQLADVDALVDHVITIGDELTGMRSG